MPSPPRPEQSADDSACVLSRLTLVGVFATAEQLVMIVLCQVDAVVTEFRPFEVVAIWVCQDTLHRWNLDLVGDGKMIDRIPDLIVLHQVDTTLRRVKVQSTRSVYGCDLRDVAVAVRIEVAQLHRVAFGVGETVASLVATNGWINAERKQVLMMLSENTIVYDRSPRNRYTRVNSCGREDSSCAHFVVKLASLIEDESKYVPLRVSVYY